MTKTGQQVADDILDLLKGSELISEITGDIYFFGTRPKNSNVEDAIIRFVTGMDEQIQTGVVIINIYVPDIGPVDDGFIQNIDRCTVLEIAANEWVRSLTTSRTNYRFKLSQTIYTEHEPDINQHFVSVRLKYYLTTF